MKPMYHVQAFINNISFPKTISELELFELEHLCFNVEDILTEKITEWTVPAWAKIGDVVFFMHAKSADRIIARLRNELKRTVSDYTEEAYNRHISWLHRADELYSRFGGAIFAIGIVTGTPYYLDEDDLDDFHWHSRIYAEIQIISRLEHPLSISAFRDFISVSRRSAITPILGPDFAELRRRLAQENQLPELLWQCDAIPLPMTKINKENWFSLTNEYRRSFLLEIQFRRFYVDYLLKGIGDRKTIFSECRCVKQNQNHAYADNVILIGGKYLPVEVKLSIDTQRDLKSQVRKYCHTTKIVLDEKTNREILPDKIYWDYVLIVDTQMIYLYDYQLDTIMPIWVLDDLTGNEDLGKIREVLLALIH